MTQVELAPEIQEDLDRILDHLIEHDVGNASERVMEMIEAIDVPRPCLSLVWPL